MKPFKPRFNWPNGLFTGLRRQSLFGASDHQLNDADHANGLAEGSDTEEQFGDDQLPSHRILRIDRTERGVRLLIVMGSSAEFPNDSGPMLIFEFN